MKLSRAFINYVFLAVVLFLSTGAGQGKFVDVSSVQSVNQGNGFLQVLWSCIYGMVLLRIIPNRHNVANFFRQNRALGFLVALAVASSLWSAAPGITLRHAVALVLTTLFAVDFALRMPLYRQLQLIEPVLIVILVGSILAQVLAPGFFPSSAGVGTNDADPDAWIGAFLHKNDFGHFIALAALVFLVRTHHSMRGRIFQIVFVMLSFVAIVKAHSSTGLASMVLMIVCIFWVFKTFPWTTRARKLALLVGAVVAVPLILLFSQGVDAVTGLLGRDATFSGRTVLWRMSIGSALRQPFLGYGYDAYWTSTTEAIRINYALGWDAPHAHNAYIELALELGLIGLIAFLIAVIAILRRAVRFIPKNVGRERMWPLAYMVFCLVYGLTETPPLIPNSIFWILFVAAACSVSQSAESQLYEGGSEPEQRLLEAEDAVPA